jgi:hypothetical protein
MANNNNTYGFDFLRTEHLNDDAQQSQQHDASNSNDAPSADDVTSSSYNTPSTALDLVAIQNKPDLEKQFDVLAFLQAHRGSGSLSPAVIYKAMGIDLDINEKVAEMLQRNPKVRVEMVPDPENPALLAATYSYQAKFSSVRDRTSLLAQINRMTSGVPMRDLLDSYLNVEQDLQALVTAGDVLAVANTEDKDKILFPRGEAFLVELDGQVTLNMTLNMNMAPPPPRLAAAADDATETTSNVVKTEPDSTPSSSTNGTSSQTQQEKEASAPTPVTATTSNGTNHTTTNGNGKITANGEGGSDSAPVKREPSRLAPPCYLVEADVDPRSQIRRGEAVQVGGQWFRVSSAVKEGPLSDQPARAQAPLSVVSLIDLSKRNEVDGYIRPLSSKIIPLDAKLSETAQKNIAAAKAARERLQKLAHGRSGGVTGQLLGIHAHASNPMTLASSFAGSTAASSNRKQHQSGHLAKSSSSSAAASQAEKDSTKAALQEAASDPALSLYSHARRHGCTRDVRDMYLATRPLVPETDADLQQLLVQHKLLEPGEQMRRPRLKRSSNVDNDGRPKKRRYYEPKKQRMTNTHLEGTEIGAVLARAAEEQRQGRSVGDGGM